MTTRARVALLALPPTLRAIPWLPLLGAAASAGVGMWLIDPAAGDGRALVALRVTAFLLALGAAFALDDPASTTLAGSPSPLAVRRAHRLLPAGAAWALCWGAAVGGTAVAAGSTPLAVPTLEAAGMLVLALALAAFAAPHVPDGRGGVVAGPALTLAMLGILLAQYRYPRWATMFALSPGMPEWDAERLRWTTLLAAAMTALMAASLDPFRARRRPA